MPFFDRNISQMITTPCIHCGLVAWEFAPKDKRLVRTHGILRAFCTACGQPHIWFGA